MNDDTENVETEDAITVVDEPKSDLDAFKEGAEQATPKAQVVDDEPKGAAGATGATGATADVGATGATAAAEPTPEKKAKAEIDAEIAGRGLKGKTADRFRELHEGFTKAAKLEKEIEPLREKAQYADDMNAVIQDTGANTQQIGTAFQYLKAINSGDPAAMNKAADTMLGEVTWLFKTLGRELPGSSPITDHKDLNEQIKAGEITKEAALEVARARAVEAREKADNDVQTRHQEFMREAKAAINGPVAALNTRLKAADPHFAYKVEQIDMEAIKAMPPAQWPAAIERAYAKIKNPPASVVAPQPLRPTGRAATLKPEPKTDLEAFRMGVENMTH